MNSIEISKVKDILKEMNREDLESNRLYQRDYYNVFDIYSMPE